MSEKNETVRPEARLPKGLFDASAGEIRATAKMLATIRDVFESYGFEPLDTPAIEYTDALGKFLPDQDRPNEGVFSFKDDDEQWLSLRYDLTAPLARYVAENYQTLPKPFRRYQSGPVWRNEKPGPGRFRQFTQFDADTVGAASRRRRRRALHARRRHAGGARRPARAVRCKGQQPQSSGWRVGGDRLEGDATARKRLTVLRAIDKYDRLGEDGVRALLGKGRKDESGDFTKGAGLAEPRIELIIDYIRGPTISRRWNMSALTPSGVVDDRGALQEFETADGGQRVRLRFNNANNFANLRKKFRKQSDRIGWDR